MIKDWLVNIFKKAKDRTNKFAAIHHLEEIIVYFTSNEKQIEHFIEINNFLYNENYLRAQIDNKNIELLDLLPFPITSIHRLSCLTFFNIKKEDYDQYINHSIYFHYKSSLNNTIELVKANKAAYQWLLDRYEMTFLQVKNELQIAKKFNYILNETTIENISFLLKKFEKEVLSEIERKNQLEKKLIKEYNKKFNQQFEEKLKIETEFVTKY